VQDRVYVNRNGVVMWLYCMCGHKMSNIMEESVCLKLREVSDWCNIFEDRVIRMNCVMY
jgi:hypothetical protein